MQNWPAQMTMSQTAELPDKFNKIYKGDFMKKKTLLCLLILAVVYTSCVLKYDSENDFQTSLLDDGKSVEITNYAGTKQIVIIPSFINGMPVTRIGDDAFKKKEITGVIIPDSVTAIGSRAFGYNPLSSVTIPAGVTEIGEAAFAFCNDLNRNITIPASVKSIGRYAFGYCRNVPSITIPANVKVLGEMAFYGWNVLQAVNIMGFDSETSADSVWHGSWRNFCDARISYQGGE
jgi:hypothetical protein